jgi:hypothetical protein
LKIVFAICARNDNYQENFLKRFQFCVNYNLYNLERSNLLNNFEYSIVDWNSDKEKPLNKTFKLINKKFENKVKFICVDPDLAKKITPNYYFNQLYIEKAHNLNLVNIDGDFIILLNSDCFFSKTSLINIFNFLNGNLSNQIKLNNSYFLIPRIIIEHDFLNRNPNYQMIDRYIERLNFSSNQIFHPTFSYIGGGFGALLASRDVWIKSNGFDESIMPNTSNDEEIFYRMSENNITYNLGTFGIISFKLQNTTKGERFSKISKFSRNVIKNINPIEDNYNWKNASKVKVKKYKANIINYVDNFSRLRYFLNHEDQINANTTKIFNIKDIIKFSKITLDDDENFNNFYLTLIIIKLLNQYRIFNYISIGYSSKCRISLLAKIFSGVELCSVDLINKDTDISNRHGILGRFLNNNKNLLRLINTYEINNMQLILDDILNEKNIAIMHLCSSKIKKDFLSNINLNEKIAFIIEDKKKKQLVNNPKFIKIFENNKFILHINKSLYLAKSQKFLLKTIVINVFYAKYLFFIFKTTFKILKIYRLIKSFNK